MSISPLLQLGATRAATAAVKLFLGYLNVSADLPTVEPDYRGFHPFSVADRTPMVHFPVVFHEPDFMIANDAACGTLPVNRYDTIVYCVPTIEYPQPDKESSDV